VNGAEDYRHIRRNRQTQRPQTPEEWIAAYRSLRKALHFKATKVEAPLSSLASFMRSRGLASFAQVTREVALAWLHSGSPQEATTHARLTPVRSFFRYLLGLDEVTENVWDSLPVPKPKHFVPHIFSLAELKAVSNHIRGKIRLGCRAYAHAAHAVAFHVLYACGLRSGEVCRFTIGDVDLGRSLFVVKNTKFGKTRLVPFNARTRELVCEYLDRFRPRKDGMMPHSPLLVNCLRKPFDTSVIHHYLTKTYRAVGVHRRRETKGKTVYGSTNVHALRHTFAVHRLLKWYEEGADVNAKLPLLAVYMGHADFKHTQWYLTVLPRFIDIAGKLFAGCFETPLKDME